MAQSVVNMDRGIDKERLRSKIETVIILQNDDWTHAEFNLLIKIIYTANKTIPKETLIDLGHENPQMLARILIHDILKPDPVETFKPKYAPKLIRNINRILFRGKQFSDAVNVAVIGDTNVGKQTIGNKLLGRKIRMNRLLTMGSEFSAMEKPVKIHGKRIHLSFHFWRMNPKDMHFEARYNFYRRADMGLAIFDISNPISFLNAIRWIEEFWNNSGKAVMPIALVGNKSDQRSIYNINSIPVEQESIDHYLNELSEKIGFRIPYIEISAHTGYGKDLLFAYLVHFYEYLDLIGHYSPLTAYPADIPSLVLNEIRIGQSQSPKLSDMITYLRKKSKLINKFFSFGQN